MTNTHITTCPVCNGDGGFESAPYGYNHIDGSPLTHWNKCTTCNGDGEVEIEAEPRTLDDLDAEDEDRPREEWPSTMDYAETPFAENH